MKYLTTMFVVAVALAALVSGCSAKHKVDSSKLTKAFASASGEVKTDIDKAVAAIKAAKYAECLAAMTRVATKGGLSSEQKQAMTDTVVDIQVLVAENPPADATAIHRAVQELEPKLQ